MCERATHQPLGLTNATGLLSQLSGTCNTRAVELLLPRSSSRMETCSRPLGILTHRLGLTSQMALTNMFQFDIQGLVMIGVGGLPQQLKFCAENLRDPTAHPSRSFLPFRHRAPAQTFIMSGNSKSGQNCAFVEYELPDEASPQTKQNRARKAHR